MFSYMLSCVNRAMLSACTPERDHKVCEVSIQIALYMTVYKRVDVFKKIHYFTIILKKFYNRLVQSCDIAVSFELAGIVDSTAIKNVTSPVTGSVVRDTLFIGETEYPYFQISLAAVCKLL